MTPARCPLEEPTSHTGTFSDRLGRIAKNATLLTAFAGLLIAIVSVEALREPPVAHDNTAGVSIGLDGDGAAEIVGIVESNRSTYADALASYTFLLPSTAEGADFRILLTGSAVLQDPVVPTGGTIKKARCTRQGQRVPCQVIAGVVDRSISGLSYAQACSEEMDKVDNASFGITVVGARTQTYQANWAFKVAVFAADHNVYDGGDQNLAVDENRRVVPDRFVTPSSRALCRVMEAPDGYSIVAARPTSEVATDLERVWVGDLDRQASAVLRRDDSLALSNAGLLLAGLLFGTSTGFLVIWLTHALEQRERTVTQYAAVPDIQR